MRNFECNGRKGGIPIAGAFSRKNILKKKKMSWMCF